MVYKQFDCLKTCGYCIIGYVIMLNHIHVLIAFHNINKSINTIIGNMKRFMAYEIVNRLKENKRQDIFMKLIQQIKKHYPPIFASGM